jgi:hypothetical protein
MLLRTSVAAFAAAISLGLWSEASNTVLAHDIYSNLRDRAGHLCCNGQDCRPVQVTVLPNGSYYLPTTNEIIAADRATPSPDDRFHQCTYSALAYDFEPGGGPVWGEVTRCFFCSNALFVVFGRERHSTNSSARATVETAATNPAAASSHLGPPLSKTAITIPITHNQRSGNGANLRWPDGNTWVLSLSGGRPTCVSFIVFG